jgi:hypothetical protein
MNRLQKKCFVVSAGMHVLLPVILVLGSALTPTPKTIEPPILTFIPPATTDKDISGGGNPNVRTAPVDLNKPPTPTPKAREAAPPKEAEKTPDPDPPKELKSKPDPESFEVAKEKKKKLPDVPLDLKPRHNATPPKQVVKNTIDDKSEREAREKQKQLLRDIGSAANDLRENSSTEVKFKDYGPGGGGIPYANFLAGVKTIYTRAWTVPDGVEDDEATTEVSVTIARDGTVLRSCIIRKSGNAAVDHSVQMTLDRVRRAVPLPGDSKEDERTVTIGFNVKAKRGLG